MFTRYFVFRHVFDGSRFFKKPGPSWTIQSHHIVLHTEPLALGTELTGGSLGSLGLTELLLRAFGGGGPNPLDLLLEFLFEEMEVLFWANIYFCNTNINVALYIGVL